MKMQNGFQEQFLQELTLEEIENINGGRKDSVAYHIGHAVGEFAGRLFDEGYRVFTLFV